MKTLSSLVIAAAMFLVAPLLDAQTYTLTISTNPPQGGTVTGAGTYSAGSTASTQIQASNGWYISNVTFNGSQTANFTHQIAVINVAFVLGGGIGNPDYTVITSDTEANTVNSDSMLSVTFNVLSPTFPQEPLDQVALVGSNATLSASVNGRLPITYQWQKSSTNVVGATNSSLTFASVQFTNTGTYMLVASNSFGVSNSLPVNLTVKDFLILTNGQLVAGIGVIALNFTTIGFQSIYPNGHIFYTLDGSTPDFNSTPYTGPFIVSTSCTVRAIAYSSDFSQTVLSDPLTVTVLPTYYVSAYSGGGGTVALNPPTGQYTNGAEVTATATANPGWTFLGWSGDINGANATNTFVVTGNMSISSQFGTTLSNTVTGNGTVLIHPSAALYPYGSSVLLSAVPNAGSYFALWGNAASGNNNPLFVSIYSPTQTVSALFASVPSGQASLTVLSQGGGSVLANPPTNRIALNSTVVLTASPLSGQTFLGWSGDASGTANPLSVTMNGNKTITGQFSRVPGLFIYLEYGLPAEVDIYGVPGEIWNLEASTNLSDWTTLMTVTNFYSYGPTYFFDFASTNLPVRMYRVVSP